MRHGLIFDLDGTLVDSLQGIAASLNRALEGAGLPQHSEPAVRGFIGDGARVLIQRSAPLDAAETLIHSLEQVFKVDYEVTWPSGTFAYAGIVELLESLQGRGYSLAVLSNKPHPFTVAIVAQLFPSIQFAIVLGQGPGVSHKPDPGGALQIATAMGRAAEDCWMIGDSTMDLETARNAGMRAMAVTWGFHDRERLVAEGADSIADQPDFLLGYFG